MAGVSVKALECVTGPPGQVLDLTCLEHIRQYLGWTIECDTSAGWLTISQGKYVRELVVKFSSTKITMSSSPWACKLN